MGVGHAFNRQNPTDKECLCSLSLLLSLYLYSGPESSIKGKVKRKCRIPPFLFLAEMSQRTRPKSVVTFDVSAERKDSEQEPSG